MNNTITELQALIDASNKAYLAFFSATLFSDSLEMGRLKEINDSLRKAIVRALNEVNSFKN